MKLSVSESTRDQMNRSEAQRRFQNLIQYRVRPMLTDRSKSDDDRVTVLKRICREANQIRAASGVVAGPGAREEIVDLLVPWLKPEAGHTEELRDWIGRTFRTFGASYEGADFDIGA
jgi:hypothetical protein